MCVLCTQNMISQCSTYHKGFQPSSGSEVQIDHKCTFRCSPSHPLALDHTDILLLLRQEHVTRWFAVPWQMQNQKTLDYINRAINFWGNPRNHVHNIENRTMHWLLVRELVVRWRTIEISTFVINLFSALQSLAGHTLVICGALAVSNCTEDTHCWWAN